MTTPQPPCIRGCTQPCRCDECRQSDQPAHDPIPRPATDGNLCKKDAEHLAGWLMEIVDLYATLDINLQQTGDTPGKRGKISGSPALIRLDVLALQDPRTMRDDDDRPGEPVSVVNVITSWARLFAEEHELSSPTDTLTQAVALLNAWLPTVCSELWVDELHDDLRAIIGLLHRAHGIDKPRPIGHCIEMIGDPVKQCGKPLYPPVGTPTIRCPQCGRRYNGLDLIRLADSREQAERIAG